MVYQSHSHMLCCVIARQQRHVLCSQQDRPTPGYCGGDEKEAAEEN